jgi:hypothetical protein
MPEPSPSFRKNALESGDQESIAGGTSFGPPHSSFCCVDFIESDIVPSEETCIIKRPFGEMNPSGQSVTTLRNAEFHAGVPESSQFCAKAGKQLFPPHATNRRANANFTVDI